MFGFLNEKEIKVIKIDEQDFKCGIRSVRPHIRNKVFKLKENTRGYDIIKRKINFFDINEDELVNEVENILKQVKL